MAGTERKKIQWHPGFYGGIELDLRDYKDDLVFETEHELSKKPIRMDLLIIYKKTDEEINNSIGRIFRKYNIVEYKGPGDTLSIDVFYKVIGYAGLFKGLGKKVNEIPASELTISFFRYSKPVKLFKDLKNEGAGIENVSPGIYYISGILNIPTQIVVMSELPQNAHLALRILSPGISEEDIRDFIGKAQNYKEPGDRHNADAVMQVCVSANTAAYRKIREEEKMCEALRELMKDEIQAEFDRGHSVGRQEGRQEGILSTLYDLVKDGMLEIKDAARKAGMTEAAFIAGMKKLQ